MRKKATVSSTKNKSSIRYKYRERHVRKSLGNDHNCAGFYARPRLRAFQKAGDFAKALIQRQLHERTALGAVPREDSHRIGLAALYGPRHGTQPIVRPGRTRQACREGPLNGVRIPRQDVRYAVQTSKSSASKMLMTGSLSRRSGRRGNSKKSAQPIP